MIVVGDLEANGLLDTVDTIWCGVFKELGNDNLHIFVKDNEGLKKFLDSVDTLIMHNGINYDIPLLKKVLDYDFKGQLVDTYVMSMVLKPDRFGGHSVEAWGKRFGMKKTEYEDWENFSWRMVTRCAKDVLIQEAIFNKLYGDIT